MSNNTTNTYYTLNPHYYTLNPHINYFLLALIKLSLSACLSFVISIERELHSHPGGICTHTLVGFGSCLFTMTSVHLRDKFPSANADPARICAQIVSGMGFLGSATIFKSQNYVKGINTAANLWISAAISMAIGLDLWEFSIVTSFFTILVLFCNNRYKKLRYGKRTLSDNQDNQNNQDNQDNQNNQNNQDNQDNQDNELDRDPQDAPYGDETSTD